jgi:AcrR family transcriptional regulator
MDGFERRKERKKESIRRAALELFQAYGFQKVSIGEIARRAGVSQVTIYNHFNSKGEMIRDVLKWYSMELFKKYAEIMEGDRPFMEKLEYIIFDKSQLVGQFQGELMQAYFQEDPEMRSFLEDLFTGKMRPVLNTFYEQGIREGYISSKFTLDTLMLYFEIIRRGFYDMPNVDEISRRNPEMLKELIQLMTYGLNG